MLLLCLWQGKTGCHVDLLNTATPVASSLSYNTCHDYVAARLLLFVQETEVHWYNGGSVLLHMSLSSCAIVSVSSFRWTRCISDSLVLSSYIWLLVV